MKDADLAELREILARTFTHVFERVDVKPSDSFFDLGGDSLLAEQLSLQVKEITGVEFPISEIFENDTPDKIAEWIGRKSVGQPVAVWLDGSAEVKAKNEFRGEGKAKNFGRLISSLRSLATRALRFGEQLFSPRATRSTTRSRYPGEIEPEILSRMRLFARGSPGTQIESVLPIYAYNIAGRLPPLFWCTVGRLDGVQLFAKALGPDQPVYAIRSLAKIVKGERKRDLEKPLSKIYADEVRRLFPKGGVCIGGNCQGARIAEGIARALLSRNYPVPLLIVNAYIPLNPYPGRVSILVGNDKVDHNDKLKDELSRVLEEGLHKEATWDYVSGDHQTYINRFNVAHFSSVVQQHLKDAVVKWEAQSSITGSSRSYFVS